MDVHGGTEQGCVCLVYPSASQGEGGSPKALVHPVMVPPGAGQVMPAAFHHGRRRMHRQPASHAF